MRTAEDVGGFCRSLPGAVQRRPFGPQPLLYCSPEKRIFCVVHEDTAPLHIIVKCDPVEALLLRAGYRAIEAGYHFNKRHWNSLRLDGSIPEGELERMIWNSYCLVTRQRERLRPLTPP